MWVFIMALSSFINLSILKFAIYSTRIIAPTRSTMSLVNFIDRQTQTQIFGKCKCGAEIRLTLVHRHTIFNFPLHNHAVGVCICCVGLVLPKIGSAPVSHTMWNTYNQSFNAWLILFISLNYRIAQMDRGYSFRSAVPADDAREVEVNNTILSYWTRR